jgi:para-aminobenzoate synthetase
MDDTPPLLFIDAYDSFSNNVIALLENELQVKVVKIHIDSGISDLAVYMRGFSGVVIGPGPGTPEKDADVGIINDIWKLANDELRPVLGICLGFQSLVCHFGGLIQRLPVPRHGQETTVVGERSTLFEGCELFSIIHFTPYSEPTIPHARAP